jgi:hypothetical protein
VTTIAEYHRDIKARLIADPLILRFDIRREKRTQDDGYLRACLILATGDRVEFTEYVHQMQGQIELVTYSFQWMDAGDNLIRRWDNAPHYPHLPNAPHHIHDGEQGTVLPGTAMSITQVLDILSTCSDQQS